MDFAVEAETVVRPGGTAGPEGSGPESAAAVESAHYARAQRVRAILWRWEQASRDATALVGSLSRRMAQSNRVNRQPDMFQNAVNLVVDVDRLLLGLPQQERRVLLEIAVDGRSEWAVARGMRVGQTTAWQMYWRAIFWMEEDLRKAGYLD